MLPDALCDVAGNSNVQRAVSLTGENVDGRLLHVHSIAIAKAVINWIPAYAGIQFNNHEPKLQASLRLDRLSMHQSSQPINLLQHIADQRRQLRAGVEVAFQLSHAACTHQAGAR